MVAHAYHCSAGKLKQNDFKFEISLYYVVRPCLEKEDKTTVTKNKPAMVTHTFNPSIWSLRQNHESEVNLGYVARRGLTLLPKKAFTKMAGHCGCHDLWLDNPQELTHSQAGLYS